MVFDGFNGQVEASFGIALFYCGPAVRDLEPKEQHDSCPLAGDYTTMYLGIQIVLWVYPHSQYTYIYVFIYIYIYVCVCLSVGMYVYLSVMYVCMYACMHACTYTYTYIHIYIYTYIHI